MQRLWVSSLASFIVDLVPAAGVLFMVVELVKVGSERVWRGGVVGKPDPVFGFLWRKLMAISVLVYTLLLALLVCLQRV